MKIAWHLFAWFVILATVAPLIRLDHWWIRGFEFPRFQLIVLGLLLIGIYLAVWRGPALFESLTVTLLLLGIGFQAYKIYPYTPLVAKQVIQAKSGSPAASLSLMIANVYMENREADQLLEIVSNEKPDLLLTVETDEWWAEQLQPLEAVYRYSVKQPLSNTYGMIFYSKLPLIDPEVRYLISDDIPSIRTQVSLPSGQRIGFYGLHPRPPSPTEAETTTQRDAELLIVGREARKQDQPVIVTGDLNDVAWSYTTTLFQKTSGFLDPRIGRGMYNTFHAKIPFVRWPLDHVFHSDHFALLALKRLPAFGSDHFPVYVELHLNPQAERRQEKPQLDAEERQQVDNKIEAGKNEPDPDREKD
jgi:endonuclease/exonuclease/phosphatase (EEP) superfamily protein YafD